MNLAQGGVFSGYVAAEEATQRLARQKLENEALALGLRQANTNADIDAKTRIALQNAAQGQLASGEAPQPVTALSTGGAPLPGGEGTSLSKLHLAEYQKETNLAKEMAKVGNTTEYYKHAKQADAALARVTQAQKEERIENKEKWERILNIASAPSDEESLNTAFNVGRQQFPDFDKYLNQLGFNQLPDGRYAWDDNAKAKVKAVQELAVNQIDRVRAEDKAAKEKLDRERLQETIRHNREMEEARARDQQIRRDVQDLSKKRNEDREEARTEREKARALTREQNTLNKDPVYQKWTQWEMGLGTAEEFKEKLKADPKAMENGKIDPSQVYALAGMFSSMKDTFRNQAGGRYQLQEIKKFNGLYDNFKEFYASFGSGNRVLGEDRAINVANTMIEMFDIANRNVVLASLEAANRVDRRYKGAGADIVLKGNLQRLFKAGQAKQVVKDGKRFIQIGDRSFEVTDDED